MPSYKRPPIIEAVIELQVAQPLDEETLKKVLDRFTEHYPGIREQTMNIDFEVGENSAKFRQQIIAHRLPADDAASNAVIGLDRITSSFSAPYPGWEKLFPICRRNWDLWKRLVGWRQVRRIGVRYVNRIDIPTGPANRIELMDYLNVSPKMPSLPGQQPMTNFALNASAPLGNQVAVLILNVATVPSALVNTLSVVVDIDIVVEKDLPQEDDALFNRIATLRALKNMVFEACITDKARALFS